MSDNIIESYLVRIGAKTDQASFNQFAATLKSTSFLVEKYSSDWLENILKFQVVTTSAFASIGAAAIGVADHLANLDQSYRLFGLHSYLPVKAARDLKQALDAVGVSMEDAVWDPELRERIFGKNGIFGFGAQTDSLLGPHFEQNMRRIRKFEDGLAKLRIAATAAAGGVVSALVDRMDGGGYQSYLDNLIDKLQKDGPGIVDFLASRLQPVLQDTESILKDTGDVAANFGLVYTNLVAALSGNKDLEGTTFSWQKLGDAVEETTHDVAKFLEYLLLTERSFAHLADAGILFASGHKEDALKELHASVADITPATAGIAGTGAGAVAGGVAGSIIGGVAGAAAGPLGILAGVGAGGSIGAAAGAGLGGYFGLLGGGIKQTLYPSTADNPDMAGIRSMDELHERYLMQHSDIFRMLNAPDLNTSGFASLISSYAQKYSVDPRLVQSIVDVESHGDPNLVSDKGAQGLMQLMPGTARQYGATDAFDPTQNIDAGTKYLAYLLQRYQGSIPSALAAYNEGEGNFDKGYMGKDVRDYVDKVMGRYMDSAGGASIGGVTVGDINVHVQGTNLHPNDVGKAVVDELKRRSDMANQRAAYQNGGTYSTAR
jgi:Transglycosylase SLT domain